MKLVGDPHIINQDDMNKYINYLRQYNYLDSICMGDLSMDINHWDSLLDTPHRVLPGNHDPYPECITHPNSLGDFGILNEMDKQGNPIKVFFCRGAWTPKNYLGEVFPEEELSSEQLASALELYLEEKPDVVITHCSPTVFGPYNFPWGGFYDSSRTGECLDMMFSEYEPRYWICGHYHYNMEIPYGDCTGVVLGKWSRYEI